MRNAGSRIFSWMARARGKRERKGAGPARTAPVAPPPGIEGERLDVEGTEWALLRFPLCAPSFPPTFSGAEREVALAVVEGRTYAEIAAARRTSVRTVANQI